MAKPRRFWLLALLGAGLALAACTQQGTSGAPVREGPELELNDRLIRVPERPEVVIKDRIYRAVPREAYACTPDWRKYLNFTPYALSSDARDNLYVAGYVTDSAIEPSAGQDDVVLRKYEPGCASEVWTVQFGGGGIDRAHAAATDAWGNVYIAGVYYSTLAYGPDAFVRKYNPSGVVQWTRFVSSSHADGAGGVAVDTGGNAYVTGSIGQDGDSDIFVAKYAPDGRELWVRQFGTRGQDDYAYGAAVDPKGNVLVAGSAFFDPDPTYGRDAFVRKYTPAGQLVWTRWVYGQATDLPRDDAGYSVAADGAGNVYLAGKYYTGAAEEFDGFVAKWAPNGAFRWLRYETGECHPPTYDGECDDGTAAVAVAPDGRVYTLSNQGIEAGGDREHDLFLNKYRPDGTPVWTRPFWRVLEHPPISYSARARALATDSRSNVYAAGERWGERLLLSFTPQGDVNTSGAAWQADPSSLVFTGEVGGPAPAPQAFSVANVGAAPGEVGLLIKASWTRITPLRAFIPPGQSAAFEVRADACTADRVGSETSYVYYGSPHQWVAVTRVCTAAP